MNAAETVRRGLRRAWWLVRQNSGDAAYENYLGKRRAAAAASAENERMSRAEFYIDSLRRRYSQVSRCC